MVLEIEAAVREQRSEQGGNGCRDSASRRVPHSLLDASCKSYMRWESRLVHDCTPQVAPHPSRFLGGDFRHGCPDSFQIMAAIGPPDPTLVPLG